MTRKEIVRSIAEDLGMTQLETREIVQKVFDAILNILVAEERVELRNFGVFAVKRRAPRKARNPRTGEKVVVPEKCVVAFRAGQVIKDRLGDLAEPSRDVTQGS